MASNTTVPVVPNPDTPLAFLPPTLADQFQISCYVVVGGLSAFVWDWLMSMPEEYKMLRKTKFRIPDITYIFSRFSTLGFCVSSTMFQVAPVPHCQVLLYILGSFVMLSISSTSLLFFYRVRAVFGNSKIITRLFGFMWMATSGLTILIPLSLGGEHMGPTNRCINTAVKSFGFAPIVLNAVNDTLVFVAISLRIVSYTTIGDSWKVRVRSFFVADGLPRLSKALLQSGQLYYFATIGFSIIFAAMLIAPGIPAVYHSMLSVPNLALANAMACRVFRAVKLGFIKSFQNTHYDSRNTGRSSAPDATGSELAFKRPTLHEARNLQVSVAISTTTDIKLRDDDMLGKPTSLVADGSDASFRV